MTEGDDPRDPTTASGMPQPWPVVDKHSTYESPPAYTSSPGSAPPYDAQDGGPRRSRRLRWLVVALVVIVLVALLLWLFLR